MDEVWLNRALQLAMQGKGSCSPNPAVGAIVVKDGIAIASGFHRGWGLPHAEVNALETLDTAEGATLYVTLEPCCHFGKTPPCTDLILKKKVSRVVFSHSDPNPVVQGKGAEQLRTAGIRCEHHPLPATTNFYRSYDFWTSTKQPWVTAKLAMTLDGKVAAKNNERLIITGSEANEFTHRERWTTDAILTTWGTVATDNPRLNARIGSSVSDKKVYVLDRGLNTPAGIELLKTASRLTFLTAHDVSASKESYWREHGAHVKKIGPPGQLLGWQEVFRHIGQDGVHELWIEAGAQTFEALILEQAVQRSLLFIAPLWLGADGISAFQTPFLDLQARAKQLQWTSYGRDVLCEILW